MKKQPELVSKWVLLDGADLPRTEAWLEKMAAQGLLFQSSSALRFGWWFFLPLVRFTFRRDTPRTGRRYRLCPTREPDTSPSGELLELYRHGGWQYTAALTADWGAFYIFYTDDPNAEEPYTDLDSFRLALRYPREGILALLALAAAGVLLRLTLASQRFSELSSSLTPDVSALQSGSFWPPCSWLSSAFSVWTISPSAPSSALGVTGTDHLWPAACSPSGPHCPLCPFSCPAWSC